ncbi:DJ-1/PfpI family protein [Eisenbergiella porci]|uniref:DJ-1/PfpI family protein n=1 Tax=Eisenbergiella TaxID=1432051 RepID=UPI003A8D2BA6
MIASVCVAAFPLAKSGVLKGRKATTCHLCGGYKRKEPEESGAVPGNEWLVVDGNIITSSCPKTAPEVTFRLLEILTTKEKAHQIREAMGF